MPSIKEEPNHPLVNGASEAETSTEHKKAFVNYQGNGQILLTIGTEALCNMPKRRFQRR